MFPSMYIGAQADQIVFNIDDQSEADCGLSGTIPLWHKWVWDYATMIHRDSTGRPLSFRWNRPAPTTEESSWLCCFIMSRSSVSRQEETDILKDNPRVPKVRKNPTLHCSQWKCSEKWKVTARRNARGLLQTVAHTTDMMDISQSKL